MYLVAALQSFLPQLHLQLTRRRVEEAAEGCGLQLLHHLLVELVSTHLQVPARQKGSLLATEQILMSRRFTGSGIY